jgi:hypothetical protein
MKAPGGQTQATTIPFQEGVRKMARELAGRVRVVIVDDHVISSNGYDHGWC